MLAADDDISVPLTDVTLVVRMRFSDMAGRGNAYPSLMAWFFIATIFSNFIGLLRSLPLRV